MSEPPAETGSSIPDRKPAAGATESGASLCFATRQVGNVHRPWQCRSTPFLSARPQFRALVEASDTQTQRDGLVNGVCVKRRAAMRAERLRSLGTAVGSLHVDRRRSGMQDKRFPRNRHGNTIGSACECLAIGAMTDCHVIRIGEGLEGHRSAVALARNLHDEAFREWMRIRHPVNGAIPCIRSLVTSRAPTDPDDRRVAARAASDICARRLGSGGR